MIEPLEKYIRHSVELTDQEYSDIEKYFVKKSFPKKHLLLSDGEVCKFEGFILKGLIKTYFLDKDGIEVILTFASENWWIGDIASFESQTPSNMFVETMEDTEIVFLSLTAKNDLLENHPKLEKMFRQMVERHLHSYQERLFGNIALSAQERYRIFLKKYPALPQRVPQHLIASYLGISAEFLSRIRSRKSK